VLGDMMAIDAAVGAGGLTLLTGRPAPCEPLVDANDGPGAALQGIVF
jgi:hypothetical protein